VNSGRLGAGEAAGPAVAVVFFVRGVAWRVAIVVGAAGVVVAAAAAAAAASFATVLRLASAAPSSPVGLPGVLGRQLP
jgi:hypothetical protein